MRKMLIAAAALLATVSFASAAEQEMELAQVPGWVLHTAQLALPGATLNKVLLDTDDMEAVFEFKGMNSKGEKVEVDVRPDGTLEEIETIVEKDAVPAKVLKLFEKKFSSFDLAKIERSQRPCRNGLIAIWWEFDGKTSDGEGVDIEIDNDGTKYFVEPD